MSFFPIWVLESYTHTHLAFGSLKETSSQISFLGLLSMMLTPHKYNRIVALSNLDRYYSISDISSIDSGHWRGKMQVTSKYLYMFLMEPRLIFGFILISTSFNRKQKEKRKKERGKLTYPGWGKGKMIVGWREMVKRKFDWT